MNWACFHRGKAGVRQEAIIRVKSETPNMKSEVVHIPVWISGFIDEASNILMHPSPHRLKRCLMTSPAVETKAEFPDVLRFLAYSLIGIFFFFVPRGT